MQSCMKGGEKMIDVNALKGIIVTKGLTQEDVANAINVKPDTFYRKMRRGVFKSDEIEKMIDYLGIADPVAIFFAKEVN